MSRDKNHQIFLAKLAEQTERYDEMIEAMRKACEISGELSMDERNLLSVGYKNVIGTRRASWRILYSIEQKEQFKGNESHMKMIQNYRITVEEELTKVCDDIIDLIDKHLLPAATDGEASVFYHKMKGDYFRYLAEFKVDSERQKAADESMKGYETASELAKAELLPTHPIRLGLALNYSVFYYEILNNIEMACTLAKIAFDEAISELDSLSEESYKDSTLIMQLLRDNLTLWTSELPDDDDDDGGKNAPTDDDDDDDDGCAK